MLTGRLQVEMFEAVVLNEILSDSFFAGANACVERQDSLVLV
jgi:hypothetical protein